MALDTQLEHLGGMVRAALVAASITCNDAHCYELPHGEVRSRGPCLELFRIGEEIVAAGTDAKRRRVVEIQLNYYAGTQAKHARDDAGATLASVVPVVDGVLLDSVFPGYHADDLETLANIERVSITGIEYAGAADDGFPRVSFRLRVEHTYLREPSNVTDLNTIQGAISTEDTPTPIDYTEFKASV